MQRNPRRRQTAYRRSELAAATIGTNLFSHAYDTIGNRLWSADNLVTYTYVANSLNQYSSIVCGSASPCEPAYDAVLAVDLPLEERDELLDVLRPHGLTLVPLISPTTGPERIAATAKGMEDSFLYAVTVKGVTGQRDSLPPELASRLEEIRNITSVPVVAGFGIRTPEDGAKIARHCDGFVIGSALVERFCNQ